MCVGKVNKRHQKKEMDFFLFVFVTCILFCLWRLFRLTFTSSHSPDDVPYFSSLLPLRRSAFIESTWDIMVDIDCWLPLLLLSTLFREFQLQQRLLCLVLYCEKTLAQRLVVVSLFLETYTHSETEILDLIASNSRLFFYNNARSLLLSDNKRCEGEKFDCVFIFFIKMSIYKKEIQRQKIASSCTISWNLFIFFHFFFL